MKETPEEARVREAQAALEAAFRAAVGAVRAVPDPLGAYRAAEALSGQTTRLSGSAVLVKAEVVADMYEAGPWTYEGLAELLGVHPSRVHQLVQTGRTGVSYRAGRRKK